MVAYLTETLAVTPGLEDVRVVGSSRSIDKITTPILKVKTDTYVKTPEAPRSKLTAEFTLVLVSPHQDVDQAEDDLEDRLEALLPLLFNSSIMWQEATQTAWDESHMSFDIRVTSIYQINEE